MKKNFFTTTALLCCFMVCFAIVADLNGKWTATVKTPDGQDIQTTYTFKTDGDKLTGTVEIPAESADITDGKINGNDFTFNVAFDGNNYPHKGKLYADSCAIDVDFGGRKMHATLKRPN